MKSKNNKKLSDLVSLWQKNEKKCLMNYNYSAI